MVCPNCGMENEEGINECIVCGTDLGNKKLTIREIKKDNTVSTVLIVVGIVVLLISFGILIYSLLNK